MKEMLLYFYHNLAIAGFNGLVRFEGTLPLLYRSSAPFFEISKRKNSPLKKTRKSEQSTSWQQMARVKYCRDLTSLCLSAKAVRLYICIALESNVRCESSKWPRNCLMPAVKPYALLRDPARPPPPPLL